MSFLKEIYNSENANHKVKSMADSLGIKLSIGDNFDWLNEEDENLKEEGILVDENLVLFLEKKGIEFSDIMQEDFRNTREGDSIEVYLKDDSGVFSANMVTEHYDINKVSNLAEYIDFNNLVFVMNNFLK